MPAHRTVRRRFHLLAWCALALLPLARAADAQRTVRLRLLPVEHDTLLPREVAALLPSRVREALARPLARRSLAFTIDLVEAAPGGRLDDAVLRALAREDTLARLVRIRVRGDSSGGPGDGAPGETILRADVAVLSAALAPELEFFLTAAVGAERPFATAIADHLAVHVGKSIRIAMLEFPMVGGDTVSYGSLRRSLPTMLATELNVSSRLVLLESMDRERMLERQRRQVREGNTDPLTAIMIGRMMNANYYIMGEYWELERALRVDVRCVSVESGEIIVTRGINVEPISIPTLHQSMRRLAADFRSAIEADFAERVRRPRYIAVAGLPPVPDTRENRAILLEMIRATSRKLKPGQTDAFRVRDGVDSVAPIFSAQQDRWLVSSQLQADLLLLLRLDRSDRDHLVLDYELFDQDEPQRTSPASDTATIASLDALLNTVTLRLLRARGITLDTAARQQMESFRYRSVHRPLSVALAVGPSGRTAPSLFLRAGAGIAVEGALVVVPTTSERLQVEALGLRLDFFGMRAGERTVVGSDLRTAVTYKLRPYQSWNPYAGVSAGLLGVVRHAGGELNFAAQPGAGLRLGTEHTLSSGRRMTYGLEFTRAVAEIPAKVLHERRFAGGRPGGLYFTIGWLFGI